MTDKPLSNMANRIINLTVQNDNLYPSGVARNFGYIESIIDRGFTDCLPAEEIVKEIQEALDRITNILSGL